MLKGDEVLLRALEKEGRLREAVFREGRYWDVILMGILRDEFDPEVDAN